LFESAEGEVFPGANGVVDIYPAMHGDLALAMHETIAEVIHEVEGRLQLFLPGTAFLEIANDADADARIVDAGFTHMAATKLLGPAGAYLYLTVTGVASVSDYEVIG